MHRWKDESKVFPLHLKVYTWSIFLVPLLPYCCNRWRGVVYFTPRPFYPRYPLNRKLDWPTEAIWTFWRRDRGKIHPRTGHEAAETERKYSSTLSLTSALDGGVVNATPGRFASGKETRYPFTGGWVGPRTGLGGCRKYRPCPDSNSDPTNP